LHSVLTCSQTSGDKLDVHLLWPRRDTEALDSSLGNTVSMFVTCLASVVGSIAVVLVVTPAVLFAVIPLAFVYRQVQVPPSVPLPPPTPRRRGSPWRERFVARTSRTLAV